jgi:hypothetical protein
MYISESQSLNEWPGSEFWTFHISDISKTSDFRDGAIVSVMTVYQG